MKTHLFLGLLVSSFFCLFNSLNANAENSYELSCRNKAKEIAAETYKNCVTEQREVQLQQIRSEYKDKLSELKSHYDNELKKLNSKSSETTARPNQLTQKEISTSKLQQKSKSMRSSGARQLPQKSVRTQVIDLSTPSNETQIEETLIESQNRLKTTSDSLPDAEIVELPTQE